MSRRYPPMPVIPGRQRGAIAIMISFMILVMLGFIGLAIDLSRLYNRKVELQTVADTAALAAARKLSGTADGIDEAVTEAATIAGEAKFNYGREKVTWSPAAIKFGSSATGNLWLDAAAAKAVAGAMSYVKVDTRQLDPDLGTIETFFIRFVAPDQTTANTSASAVAGRASLKVTPLAICAMSALPAAARPATGELVQYGFRRGVGYDLMQLNPNGAAPANFVINPIDTNGAPGAPSNTMAAVVGPFVCAGTIPMGSIAGAELRVGSPFPLASLFEHLNSRFDQYGGGFCNYRSAPPDVNIKPFHYDKDIGWLKSATPDQQTAKSTNASPLSTIADLLDESGNTAPMYGALWTSARPVPFSAYVPGMPEPKGGYAPFPRDSWVGLYGNAKPEPKASYPSATPYGATGGTNFTPPATAHGKGIKQRRVLHVPLLSCPVSGGANAQASVLAVAKFFMTVPATATSISAEFAGIATGDALSGSVELYK